MRLVDPTTMTPSERLDEIAELLARGAQRWLANEGKAVLKGVHNAEIARNRLAVLGSGEAPCRSRVQSPQSRTP